MSKRKKGRSQLDGALIQLKNRLNRSLDHQSEFSKFKCFHAEELIGRHFNILINDKLYRQHLIGEPFPRDYKALGSTAPLNYYSFETEYRWLHLVLSRFAKELSEFQKLEHEFYTHFIRSDLKSARIVLDEVESKFGVSYWGIEANIYLLEFEAGFTKQKEFAETILGDESTNWYTRIYTHFCSTRAERSLRHDDFVALLENKVEEWELADVDAQYVVYKQTLFNRNMVNDLRYPLARESNASVIDRYLTFIHVSQFVVANSAHKEHLPVLRKWLLPLAEKIDDKRLQVLGIALGQYEPAEPNTFGKIFTAALEDYTAGRYEECIKRLEPFTESALDLSLYDVYVRALIRSRGVRQQSENKTLVETLVHALIKFTWRTHDIVEGLIELYVIATKYPFLPWSEQIISLIHEELDPKQLRTGVNHVIASALRGEPFNPNVAVIIENQTQRAQFYEALAGAYGTNRTNSIVRSVLNADLLGLQQSYGNGQIPKERYFKYAGLVLFGQGKYDDAIVHYKTLQGCNDELAFQDATKGLTDCYLAIDDLESAIQVVVDTYLRHENLVSILPLEAIMQRVHARRSHSLCSLVDFPIFYFIFWKTIDSGARAKENLDEAYEIYLEAKQTDKPSLLEIPIQPPDLRKHLFFLSQVCTPPVLDSTVVFDNTDELREERIAICQILAQMDAKNIKTYSEEISSITRDVILTRAMRQIDQSKISVDVEGIKTEIVAGHRVVFDRYKLFKYHYPVPEGSEDVVINVGDAVNPRHLVIRPVKEAENIFRSLITDITHRFTSSSQYGLDGYLSALIRHGTLAGQLRAPLELARLVTEKQKDTQTYLLNRHWASACDNSADNDWLQYRLMDFSRAVDELIDMLNNQWIRIKNSQSHPEGFFDYLLSVNEFGALEAQITEQQTFDEFLEILFKFLWARTESNLEKIRAHILGPCNSKFDELFRSLSQDILNRRPEGFGASLTNAISSARTEIQYSVRSVADWFSMPKPTDIEDYDASLLVEIAQRAVRYINPSKSLIFSSTVQPDIKLAGRTLNGLSTILISLYDNAIKHGAIRDDEIVIKTNIAKDQDVLTLAVQNNLGKDFNYKEGRKLVKARNKKLAGEEDYDSVLTEGGTGLVKIQKILNIEFASEAEIKLEIRSRTWFVTSIRWKATKWIR